MALLERLLKTDKDLKRHINLEGFFGDINRFASGRIASDELEKLYNFTPEDQKEWYAIAYQSPGVEKLDARINYFYNVRGLINQAINTHATVDQLRTTLGIGQSAKPKAEPKAEPKPEAKPKVAPKENVHPKANKVDHSN
jgi:hypothetical protein